MPVDATGLDWPSPPWPVQRMTRLQRGAGWFLILLCGPLLVGLAVLVFGYTDLGRGLVLDTASSLRLGTALDARIDVRGCCHVTVTWFESGNRVSQQTIAVELSDADDLGRVQRARRIFGTIGLSWPVGVMLSRWLVIAPVFVALGFLGAMVWLACRLLRNDRGLARAAREGSMVPVDLLFEQGTWRFAYRDRRGRQRFAKAAFTGQELRLDGIVTRGVALMAPNTGRAWLIYENLYPLKLAPADAAALVAQTQPLRGAPRPALPAFEGEAPAPADRLAAIRGLLENSPGKEGLERAYVLAWRLIWDFPDMETAQQAFALRNQIGAKLGPRRTFDLLLECRRRYTPETAGAPAR